jgi:hypothetical protein
MAKKKRKRSKKSSKKHLHFAPKAGIEAALNRRALVKKITGELKELE